MNGDKPLTMEQDSTLQIYDSLPYFDNDLEQYPHLKEIVEKELSRGVPKHTNKLHPKLAPPIELFQNNPLLAAELRRVENHEPITPLDVNRYQLPAPTNTRATEEDWRKALDNAKSQLEHQKIRLTNIQLLQKYGANAWRVSNYLLEADTVAMEKLAEELEEQVTEINRARKNFQNGIGEQITALERKWTDLISNVLQIELATSALEAEIRELEEREMGLQAVLAESAS